MTITHTNEYRIFQALTLALVALALVLCSPGCMAPKIEEHVETVTAGCDGYDRLIRATLDGSISPEHGQAVTPEDLGATPDSVREFVDNLISAVYVTRKAWHTVRFMLGNGPDPAALDLERPALPEPVEGPDPELELLEDD